MSSAAQQARQFRERRAEHPETRLSPYARKRVRDDSPRKMAPFTGGRQRRRGGCGGAG